MSLENLRSVRLTHDYNIKPFDCSDDDLNGFLFEDSKIYLQELMAITYLLEQEDKTVAFYCVSNDKITKDRIGQTRFEEIRTLKFEDTCFENFPSFPAVKLGRLGVDNQHQGQGIGKMILDFMKFSFVNGNKTGCRFITVDAYAKSTGFYEKNDFIFLTSKDEGRETRAMYYDLSQLYS